MGRISQKTCKAICNLRILVLLSLIANFLLHGYHSTQIALADKIFWVFKNTTWKHRSTTRKQNRTNTSLHVAPAADRSPFFELFNVSSVMGPTHCDRDFGFGLVRRWKTTYIEWCKPTIACYPMKQNDHGGDGDNLCVIHNATLNMQNVFNDSARMRNVVLKYRDTKHADMPYVHFHTPVVSTRCEKDPKEWKANMLPGWNADWMGSGLNINASVECSQVEQKPLLIIQRHGFANFYHDSEDFFNAFLALLITGLRPDEVTVLLSDLYPWGPYEDFWKHLFPDVRSAWEMREIENVCFPKIIVGIYGPASPLTLLNKPTPCFKSPLVKGYTQWTWSSFGLNASMSTEKVPQVLWMSRNSSVLWPEQAYCDDRYFACGDWTHLGRRTMGRVIQNEAQIVARLQEKTEIKVLYLDFNTLPFKEQVRSVASSDVMVGPHGAGLTHLMFLPDHACVFEIFIDGSESNIHYLNLAAWRGVRYRSMIASNPAPAQEIISRLWSECISGIVTST